MSLRMRQICLVARHLAPVVDEFQTVLGLEVCHRDAGVGKYGLENALFPIGHNFLEVVAPVRDSAGGFSYLVAGLKAWLEHGVQLNLVGYKFPAEMRSAV